MLIETRLSDQGLMISNPKPRKGQNPAFFYYEFAFIPQPGQRVTLHDYPGGDFVVVAVTHEVLNGKGSPLLLLERLKDQTRQEILERYGWVPGKELKPSAFEVERISLEN